MRTRYKIIGNTIEQMPDNTPMALDVFCSSEKADPIDWEHRRYEIAKDTMQGILYGLMTQEDIEISCHNVAKSAVMLADALIAELKKGGCNGSH